MEMKKKRGNERIKGYRKGEIKRGRKSGKGNRANGEWGWEIGRGQ